MSTRTTYISNGTRERARRRWWLMLAINTACMLAFTAALIWLGALVIDSLDHQAQQHCETMTTEITDGVEYSFCDG